MANTTHDRDTWDLLFQAGYNTVMFSNIILQVSDAKPMILFKRMLSLSIVLIRNKLAFHGGRLFVVKSSNNSHLFTSGNVCCFIDDYRKMCIL